MPRRPSARDASEPRASRAHLGPAIELRHLSALAALAPDGSLGDAARQLGVAPATVGRWIARLEATLERRLVDRGRDGRPGCRLTPAGRLLAEHAQAIEASMSVARHELDALAAGETGVVRIGTCAPRHALLMTRIVTSLRHRRPRLAAVAVDVEDHRRGVAAVLDGRIDLLLTDRSEVVAQSVEAHELLRDPFVLLVAARSPLAERAAPLAAEDLDGLRLVAPRASAASAELARALRACGARPIPALRADEPATVRALVACAQVAAIVPRMVADPDDPGTVAIDLDHLVPTVPVTLRWHQAESRRPVVVAVREAARAACAEVAARRALLAAMAR